MTRLQFKFIFSTKVVSHWHDFSLLFYIEVASTWHDFSSIFSIFTFAQSCATVTRLLRWSRTYVSQTSSLKSWFRGKTYLFW